MLLKIIFPRLISRRLPIVMWLGLFVAIPGLAVTVAMRRYSNSSASKAVPSLQSQQMPQGRDRMLGRLALQPQADKFRRLIGQRFSQSGREVATIIGSAVIGTERYQVRMVRSQDDDDERIAILLNGNQASLTWSGQEGARSGSNAITGTLRKLVERLALDSPDQFVLAQLRGASYFTVAKNVRPTGIANNYAGPIWNIIRVTEPTVNPRRPTTQIAKPESLSRLYFTNVNTGLIDKVVSQEADGAITAEFSSWSNQNGEAAPGKITWKKGNEVVMEFTLTNVSHSAKQ
ncbi:MAG: hypothetical protein HOP19_11255 [Acidobacteria bacterium]|nr:hypothetical protein [Acidobacteriota bacterium]